MGPSLFFLEQSRPTVGRRSFLWRVSIEESLWTWNVPTRFSANASGHLHARYSLFNANAGSDRLGQSIWEKAAWHLLNGDDASADALLEEFDVMPLWHDPLR